MKFNQVVNNSGLRTPTGYTENQPLAGTSSVGFYVSRVGAPAAAAPYGNTDAASVIQSNGELVGNAQLGGNPLPPGVTS